MNAGHSPFIGAEHELNISPSLTPRDLPAAVVCSVEHSLVQVFPHVILLLIKPRMPLGRAALLEKISSDLYKIAWHSGKKYCPANRNKTGYTG